MTPLPGLIGSNNVAEQGREVLHGVAMGVISPDETEGVFRSLVAQSRITEVTELLDRIEAREQRVR